MTIEIPAEKWTEFFDDLSKRRFGWTTRIEVLDESVGNQILSDGLPLSGITFAESANGREIELLIGEKTDHHTHTIRNPVKVEFLDDGDFLGGVLEITEENNTRTLVRLLDPMPIYLGYETYSIVLAGAK